MRGLLKLALIVFLLLVACSTQPRTIRCIPSKTLLPLSSYVLVSKVLYNQEYKITLGETHGAGTIVGWKNNRGVVLTAKHVVADAGTKIEVITREGNILEGRWLLVIAPSKHGPLYKAKLERNWTNGTDASLLSFDPGGSRQDLQAAKTARRNPRPGTPLFTFGAPKGYWRKIVRREVDRYCRPRDGCGLCNLSDSCMILNEGIEKGFSGGGIFNHQGELVGMSIGFRTTVSTGEVRALCIGAERLLPDIEKLLD